MISSVRQKDILKRYCARTRSIITEQGLERSKPVQIVACFQMISNNFLSVSAISLFSIKIPIEFFSLNVKNATLSP